MIQEIPKGTRCELCGMLAEFVEKDKHGAVHYFCAHHVSQGADNESNMNSRISNSQIRKFGSHSQLAPHNKHAGHTTNMFKTRFWVCLILTLPILAYAEIVQRVLGIQVPDFYGRAYFILALASIIFFYGGWVFLKGALTELKARLPGMMTLIALAIIAAYAYSVVAIFTKIGEPLFWEIGSLITIMLLGHWIEMSAVGHASGALKELAKLLPDMAERILPSPQPSPAGRGGLKEPSPAERGGLSVSPLLLGEGQGDGGVEVVSVSELHVGDIVLVRPGAKVPADGEITEGISSLNEAMITGESKPVDKQPGAPVIAGTVNGEGVLKVRVTKIGEQTALAGIMRLVAQAQSSRSRVQALADRAAYYLTLIAVGVGVLTTIVWLGLDAGVGGALTMTVAVLVIACPHALGLAVPLVASISTTLSARNGILVREKLALELARKIDIVLFDKTGTLTKGEYGVTDIVVSLRDGAPSLSEDGLLALAAAVESGSEHPVAKAIVKAASERDVEISKATGVKALPGRGVEGVVDGRRVLVGGENLVRELGLDIQRSPPSGGAPPLGGESIAEISAQGKTVVYVIAPSPQPSPAGRGGLKEPFSAGRGGEVIGAFGVADIIREESREAVEVLHKMGVRVAMVTGDAKPVAKWVAKELQIDEVYAEVLPQNKVEVVQRLQNSKFEALNSKQSQNFNVQNSKYFGFRIWNLFRISNLGFRISQKRVVAMVGDGINDAPALTAADVGIAIGAGTDVAIESAGIILIKNDPRDIARVIKLSRATYRKMVENLIWATGYNAFAIPAAAGAFVAWGIILAPALAALFMSLSTVIVAFNAQLLRRVRL